MERVEIFGKVIVLEDERMIDIIIHNKMKEIATHVAHKVEDLLTNGKEIEYMLSISDTIVQGLLASGLAECLNFLKELGIENVNE